MDVRVEDPRLPPPPEEYSRREEVEFRAAVLRQLRELVVAVRAIAENVTE
ncbi:MAG TPA: hypothetical protein VKA48_01425 [Gammaproteobacteria bacterium]|nr:hypothetical protein [Gammaproteobacteria bacterium]